MLCHLDMENADPDKAPLCIQKKLNDSGLILLISDSERIVDL